MLVALHSVSRRAYNSGGDMGKSYFDLAKAPGVRLVVLGAVVLVAVFFCEVAANRYIRNFIHGPYLLGTSELLAITDVSVTPRNFVRVEGFAIHESGLARITTRPNKDVVAVNPLYALAVGDKILLCQSSEPKGFYEGELLPMPEQVLQLLDQPGNMSIREHILPFYLDDTASYRGPGMLVIAVILIMGIALAKATLPGVPMGNETPIGRARSAHGVDIHANVAISLRMAMAGGQLDVVMSSQRRLRVKCPAGIDSGQTLRVAGQGERGKDGSPGDLYVEIELAPDPRFERRGDDLVYRARISSAAGGAGVLTRIELPDGTKVDVPVPAGTPLGGRITIAQAGMPRLDRSGRGDLHVFVEVPEPTARTVQA
jgi:hypothetical protein